MASPMHHLAQLNVARMVAPLYSPEMAEFMDNLEPINALADRSPGFVWRLQSDEGDATSIRPFGDEWVDDIDKHSTLSNVDEFCKQFIQQRMIHHTRAAKLEVLQNN